MTTTRILELNEMTEDLPDAPPHPRVEDLAHSSKFEIEHSKSDHGLDILQVILEKSSKPSEDNDEDDDEDYISLKSFQGFQSSSETELGFPDSWKESRGRARDSYRSSFPGALDKCKGSVRGKVVFRMIG